MMSTSIASFFRLIYIASRCLRASCMQSPAARAQLTDGQLLTEQGKSTPLRHKSSLNTRKIPLVLLFGLLAYFMLAIQILRIRVASRVLRLPLLGYPH